jgi:hypothetical protein
MILPADTAPSSGGSDLSAIAAADLGRRRPVDTIIIH